MHYRRRLRSRIIVSFLLLGFGLTAAFALASPVPAETASFAGPIPIASLNPFRNTMPSSSE